MPRLPEPSARDVGLVERARAGDVTAFEALYRAHVGRVLALVRRLASRSENTEELVQDVFVRAHERLASFRGESAFSTWLHRLAVNVVLEGRRARSRREARFPMPGDVEALETIAERPDRGVGMDLERAIAALPEGARTVLVLHDVEGYQHDEIATLLEVTTGTTKAQLHRARRLLREVLER